MANSCYFKQMYKLKTISFPAEKFIEKYNFYINIQISKNIFGKINPVVFFNHLAKHAEVLRSLS